MHVTCWNAAGTSRTVPVRVASESVAARVACRILARETGDRSWRPGAIL